MGGGFFLQSNFFSHENEKLPLKTYKEKASI